MTLTIQLYVTNIFPSLSSLNAYLAELKTEFAAIFSMSDLNASLALFEVDVDALLEVLVFNISCASYWGLITLSISELPNVVMFTDTLIIFYSWLISNP
jgi:hypothetical protein